MLASRVEGEAACIGVFGPVAEVVVKEGAGSGERDLQVGADLGDGAGVDLVVRLDVEGQSVPGGQMQARGQDFDVQLVHGGRGQRLGALVPVHGQERA